MIWAVLTLVGFGLYLLVAVLGSAEHVSRPTPEREKITRPALEVGFTVAVVVIAIVFGAWLIGIR